MQFEGALIREQGVKFAIVVVKWFVLNDAHRSGELVGKFQLHFGTPVVLMAQDARGVPTYRGRGDLVRFLANVSMEAIPWSRFTLN